jgi:hypothetical protein
MGCMQVDSFYSRLCEGYSAAPFVSQGFEVSEPDENILINRFFGPNQSKFLFLNMGSYGTTVLGQFMLLHLLIISESFAQLKS